MSPRVAIYQLRSKFVNQREDIPDDARQIVYYTLAVGHHVGVMDCFSNISEISLEAFKNWVVNLPEGPGRTKLEGVLRYGEIEINHSHVKILQPLVQNDNALTAPPAWIETLSNCLQGMLQEPALYLMMRKHV